MKMHSETRDSILTRFSWLWLGGAVLLGAYLILTSGSPTPAKNATASRSDPSRTTTVGATTVKFDQRGRPESATRKIEDIRVGDRVLASNPEVSEQERASRIEPDWNDWWNLSLQMPLPKDDDQANAEPKILHIELLRPDSWVREQIGFVVDEIPQAPTDITPQPVAAVEVADKVAQADSSVQRPLVPLSPLRGVYRDIVLTSAVLEGRELELAGLTVEMDLPEMGAFGTALITDIKPCLAVYPGDGQVVTATFKHPPSTTVLDVTFADGTDSHSHSALSDASQTSSLGVTDNHLFWSVDREAYVPIGQMSLGERVITFQGDTKRVAQKLPRPDPQHVYNLEVYGEHVYFVGDEGLLAHNSCAPSGGAHGQTKLPWGDGLESHHLPAKSVNGLHPDVGPAIQMTRADHLLTSSHGSRAGSAAYRSHIEDLLSQGKVREAMAIEIRDVRRAAQQGSGDMRKYNDALREMLEYARGIGYVP